MTTHDQAQSLLNAYCEHAGLAAIRLDAQGCARLRFADSTILEFEADERGRCIQLHGLLSAVPDRFRETLYRHLLESNLFGAATGGARLCIDPADDSILLGMSLPPQMPRDEFAQVLGEFAHTVRSWRDHLASGAWSKSDDFMSTVAVHREFLTRC